MRILANENFPYAAVTALRNTGHDVFWIRTEAPEISDREVLRLAQADNRILITLDKDFGELAFALGLPATNGIVLFRIRASSPARIAAIATAALGSRTDWAGPFSVVENDRIRMTPLK